MHKKARRIANRKIQVCGTLSAPQTERYDERPMGRSRKLKSRSTTFIVDNRETGNEIYHLLYTKIGGCDLGNFGGHGG